MAAATVAAPTNVVAIAPARNGPTARTGPIVSPSGGALGTELLARVSGPPLGASMPAPLTVSTRLRRTGKAPPRGSVPSFWHARTWRLSTESAAPVLFALKRQGRAVGNARVPAAPSIRTWVHVVGARSRWTSMPFQNQGRIAVESTVRAIRCAAVPARERPPACPAAVSQTWRPEAVSNFTTAPG